MTTPNEKTQTTQLLLATVSGDGQAAEQLMPLVYEELHRIAQSYFRKESTAHTLQPTALVNEVYLKLIDQNRTDWQGRTHFLAVGAQAMRRILVDHARMKGRTKRGGGGLRFSLNEALAIPKHDDQNLPDLHEALEDLAKLDPRQAQIVELRYFGGLTVLEIAEVLGVSERTIRNDSRMAQAWLRQALEDSDS